MTSLSPNFAGFAEAQKRLRQEFGQELAWISYPDPAYPEGTEINPDNDRPYDPEVEPVNGGEVRTIVLASVVTRPVAGSTSLKDSVVKKAIGWLEEGGIVLIVDIEDYHLVRDATEVEYAGDVYTIRDDDHDYLGPVDRWLFHATL